MTTNDELESLYGELASHSEYKRGETVRYYRGPDEIVTGEILWIVGPHDVLMRDGRTVQAPTSYIVVPLHGGFPDVAYSGDIIAS